MTVIDSRVISILARRAPQVTVVQAQNICTDMAETGMIQGGFLLPVDNSFNPGVEDSNLYLLQNKFIEETSTSPEDEPDKEEVERLCDEARKTTPVDNEELRLLRKAREYIDKCGYTLGFLQWAEH